MALTIIRSTKLIPLAFMSNSLVTSYISSALTLLRAHNLARLFCTRNCDKKSYRDIETLLHSRSTKTPDEYDNKLTNYLSKQQDDRIERIFVLSDLHTDHVLNMEWLEQRCMNASSDLTTGSRQVIGTNDAMIIAGDISHDLERLEQTFDVIKTNLNCTVWFVPGNHEAWLDPRKENPRNSFEKLQAIAELCEARGVRTQHAMVGSNHPSPTWIVPMQSWYDGSLMLPNCDDLVKDMPHWPWVDFMRCDWTDKYTIEPSPTNDPFPHAKFPTRSLVKTLLKQNSDSISDIQSALAKTEGGRKLGLISFSHFLPNLQTLPDWKDPSSESFEREVWLDHPGPGVSAKFALVAGSNLIDKQLRSILTKTEVDNIQMINTSFIRQIHVFGHSHRPKDFEYQNIRYVHNPLGKPRERESRMISPDVDFQCIWDTRTNNGEVKPERPIIRYWEEQGGGLENIAKYMRKRQVQRKMLLREIARIPSASAAENAASKPNKQ